MKSFDIALTVSPALDKAHFSGLVPEQKIRCQTPLFDAGRRNQQSDIRLEGKSLAVITGGSTGEC
jgi:6-phosphofructokinase 2